MRSKAEGGSDTSCAFAVFLNGAQVHPFQINSTVIASRGPIAYTALRHTRQ